MAAIYWLIAFVILVGIEIMTTALTTIWFAGGAALAFVAALFGAPVPVQLLVFVVISFMLLFLTRPLAVRYINTSTVKTNVDSLIGKDARVTAEVNNAKETGTVSVQGQEWTARSEKEDAVYPEGTRVWIREIQGVKLIVSDEKAVAFHRKGGSIMGFLFIFPLLIVILAVLASCIRIVPQAQALVVERLGAYLDTWSVGVHFLVPFVDRVAKKVSLKEQVVDFDPQPVITKDNVTMRIDTVVFFQITDPKLYAYGVVNPIMAIENLTATTLRNIIGDLELDQTLTSRETINTKMRASLDVATDPWGIKVNRVELKNIIPPAAIQDAMEKQMKAERERREAILRRKVRRNPRSWLRKVKRNPRSWTQRQTNRQPSFMQRQRRNAGSARRKVRLRQS